MRRGGGFFLSWGTEAEEEHQEDDAQTATKGEGFHRVRMLEEVKDDVLKGLAIGEDLGAVDGDVELDLVGGHGLDGLGFAEHALDLVGGEHGGQAFEEAGLNAVEESLGLGEFLLIEDLG
ncbi:hypothetical protein GCM10023213_17030 [Prosthecobacter algae]|uniref:Uncharacterized protein n=1 Tax=Prosthecobacter algae TaxID=1144682 RepID=A0ABP9P3G7_9BACT